MNLGREKRYLEVVLTEEQRKARGLEAAQRATEARIATEEAEGLKRRARDAKERADDKRVLADDLLRTFATGREFKDVECELIFDGAKVRIQRLDTGDTVESREPSEHEMDLVRNPKLPIRGKKGEKDGLAVVG